MRSALTAPYPPATPKGTTDSHPLEFELNTIENAPPTSDQIRILLSYLKLPLSSLVSTHPTSGISPADSPEALVEAATSNPKIFRFPVMVNWDDGEAALDVGGVRKMLDKLAERRHISAAEGADKPKGWFS